MWHSPMVNPHDIMFLRSGEEERAHETGAMGALTHEAQRLGFMRQYDVQVPDNFHDDLEGQPYGVGSYKRNTEWNYGAIRADREDLWLVRRNYLINCLRMVDQEFGRSWTSWTARTCAIPCAPFTSDHGEMNGAHRMAQKGAIPFQEASIVNMTAVYDPGQAEPPRGSASAPGDEPEKTLEDCLKAGEKYGAPDMDKRTFYWAVSDGRHKLVRWFSSTQYGVPETVEELHATSDVALYDLKADPRELRNIGDPAHLDYDEQLVATMLDKLFHLVRTEVGERDEAPFDLDLFVTREFRYQVEDVQAGAPHGDDRSGPHHPGTDVEPGEQS